MLVRSLQRGACELQRAEHLADYRGLDDGRHDLERAALAQGASAHNQLKHPRQHLRPAPAWRDRAARAAVRESHPHLHDLSL
jgi:hypothetical protein